LNNKGIRETLHKAPSQGEKKKKKKGKERRTLKNPVNLAEKFIVAETGTEGWEITRKKSESAGHS